MGDVTVDDTEAARLLQEAHDEFERDAATTSSGKQLDNEGEAPPEKPYPAYFFPQLSVQRSMFCLDVLKREDIRSVSPPTLADHAIFQPS